MHIVDSKKVRRREGTFSRYCSSAFRQRLVHVQRRSLNLLCRERDSAELDFWFEEAIVNERQKHELNDRGHFSSAIHRGDFK